MLPPTLRCTISLTAASSRLGWRLALHTVHARKRPQLALLGRHLEHLLLPLNLQPLHPRRRYIDLLLLLLLVHFLGSKLNLENPNESRHIAVKVPI